VQIPVIIMAPANSSTPPVYMDGINGGPINGDASQHGLTHTIDACLDGSTCRNARCYDGPDCKTSWEWYEGPVQGPGCGCGVSYSQSPPGIINGSVCSIICGYYTPMTFQLQKTSNCTVQWYGSELGTTGETYWTYQTNCTGTSEQLLSADLHGITQKAPRP
jgi:hypothetical protein